MKSDWDIADYVLPESYQKNKSNKRDLFNLCLEDLAYLGGTFFYGYSVDHIRGSFRVFPVSADLVKDDKENAYRIDYNGLSYKPNGVLFARAGIDDALLIMSYGEIFFLDKITSYLNTVSSTDDRIKYTKIQKYIDENVKFN